MIEADSLLMCLREREREREREIDYMKENRKGGSEEWGVFGCKWLTLGAWGMFDAKGHALYTIGISLLGNSTWSKFRV